ncbi:hypothetical protein [Agrococcus sp. Marseille-Q4369]|uniref:hypothetical protein n=1 Tax=Agrococcus sp. Marseille-Q4369 TaxID=2810513 RepID=UPI001B8C3C45|nr:hypothetical protein [Agrococcus sp. Marseille-Q4369]QUW17737.1 hypothetical protein JSQ78_07545 [Agrococcus sp. Marseille-Q4369]
MTRAVTIAAAVAALLALTGCAGAAAPAPSEPAPSFTAAPSASAPTDPSAEPGASADPLVMTDDWLEHASSDGSVSFRYPPTWTLEATAEPHPDPDEPPWEAATLTAPNGQQLLRMAQFPDIGGSCEAPLAFDVLAVEPAASMPFEQEDDAVIATVAVPIGERWEMGIGITSTTRSEGAGCQLYFVGMSSAHPVSMGTHFSMPREDPLWMIDSLDDARAYMETDEYATIIEILRSFETS